MSMTENEAKLLEKLDDLSNDSEVDMYSVATLNFFFEECANTIRKFIGEIQSYRATGLTPELIDRLEEQKSDLTTWAEDKAFEIGIETAISIVKQLAEEYKQQNIDQDLMIVESLSSLYPMMQTFEEEAIDRVIERAKYNYGWILCSERLPEVFDNVLICTKEGGRAIGHRCPNQKTGRYYDLHGSAIDSVIAWQPLPKPFKLKD